MSAERPTSAAARLESEVLGANALRRRRPGLFWAGIIAMSVISAWWMFDNFAGIRKLKDMVSTQEKKISALQIRNGILETQLAPIKTAAILKYGNAGAEAMAQVVEDVRKLEAAIRRVENKIRTLSAKIEIEFSTQWKDGKIPDPATWILRGTKTLTATFITEDGRQAYTEFHHGENFTYTRGDASVVKLTYTATASPSSSVFGWLPEELRKIKDFFFVIPGANKRASESETATIHHTIVQFYVNGLPVFFARVNETLTDIQLRNTDLSLIVTKEIAIETGTIDAAAISSSPTP